MTEATPEPETTVLDEVTGALRFILAFYEPGQRHLDTEAWKHAEAGGRRALARGEAALAALQEQRAEISRLQQELSACKAERDEWRASAAEFKGLCEEWQALAEAAEAREKQLRAALEEIAALSPDKDSEEGWNEWGEADCFGQAQDIARRALGQTEPGEQA